MAFLQKGKALKLQLQQKEQMLEQAKKNHEIQVRNARTASAEPRRNEARVTGAVPRNTKISTDQQPLRGRRTRDEERIERDRKNVNPDETNGGSSAEGYRPMRSQSRELVSAANQERDKWKAQIRQLKG